MNIAGRAIGGTNPCYIIAEIGINHNGSVEIARQLIDAAIDAGADAVKFQKRTPEICVPKSQQDVRRDTPWGRIDYLDYRYKIEFSLSQFANIDQFCESKGITWFASSWDEPSLVILEKKFNIPCHKIPSAMATNYPLINKIAVTGKPIIASTGGLDSIGVGKLVTALGNKPSVLMQCTAAYPVPPEALHLNVIKEYKSKYPNMIIGYSNHNPGIIACVAAVAMGAKVVEAHITLDRAMWGTDQAASIEPHGFKRMVKYIRDVEKMMGGTKQFLDIEKPVMEKLRWHEQAD